VVPRRPDFQFCSGADPGILGPMQEKDTLQPQSAPAVTRVQRHALLLAGVLAVCIGLLAWIMPQWLAEKPVVLPAIVEIDKSPVAQQQRKAGVDELLRQGLIRRIEAGNGNPLRVWLPAHFYALDTETRRRHVELVYSYYFDGRNPQDAVQLRDARNGNVVGRYNPYDQGLMMVR